MCKSILRMLIVLVTAAAACSQAGGKITGANETCSVNGSSGVCDGKFAKLSGTYDKVISAEGCHTNVAVEVEILASVVSGNMRVLTVGPDGTEYTAEATAGNPARLTGAAAGCQREFHVIFAADRGEATGVEYTIHYNVP